MTADLAVSPRWTLAGLGVTAGLDLSPRWTLAGLGATAGLDLSPRSALAGLGVTVGLCFFPRCALPGLTSSPRLALAAFTPRCALAGLALTACLTGVPVGLAFPCRRPLTGVCKSTDPFSRLRLGVLEVAFFGDRSRSRSVSSSDKRSRFKKRPFPEGEKRLEKV